MDPVEALLRDIREYVRRRGAVIDILRATGQERFKMSVRSFYYVHDESTGYDRFEDLLRDLESSGEALERLGRIGIRLVRVGGERYLEVPSRMLISMLEEERRASGRG